MFQGNWKCSSCGDTITELPFEPRSEEGLVCRDCYRKKKEAAETPVTDADTATEPEATKTSEPEATPAGERKMFSGEWTCASCGAPITSLPFEPRNTDNLKCLDCFKKG